MITLRFMLFGMYCGVSLVAWFAIFLGVSVLGLSPWAYLAVPVILPGALIGGFQLFVLRPRCTVFGGEKRRRFPDEREIASTVGGGAFGWWRATWPLARWTVFPSGLGVWMLFIGRVFVPWSAVRRVDKEMMFARIEHDSPELLAKTIHLPLRMFDLVRPQVAEAVVVHR